MASPLRMAAVVAGLLALVVCSATVASSSNGTLGARRFLQDTSGQGGGSGDHSDWLDPHNAARRAVGVADLTWDDTVAASAQQVADQVQSQGCTLDHSQGQYGENLSGSPSPGAAVQMWVDEKQKYTLAVFPYGCSTGNWQDCGHYTQVVWGKTQRLGCGTATCGTTSISVCHYDPRGNTDGQSPY